MTATLALGLHVPRLGAAGDYAVVDTGQSVCYDNSVEIACPAGGAAFYGQDAQYAGTQPSFADNGDGTVSDQASGLMWQKSPDTEGDSDIDADDKLAWTEVQTYCANLVLATYDDWRLPDIKELYSLIDFSGIDPSGYVGSDTSGLVPFIDTDYFDFAYGDTGAGERIIDAQYWSSTEYVGTIFGGDAGVFGVNFADGRIKGYLRDTGPGGSAMTEFVRCVRGKTDYGVNDFIDNGDGTITDSATGLMWQQADSGSGMNWEAALAYAEGLALADHYDWRLPDAKELQSIVDYTRSPSTTGSAAIAALFTASSMTDEGGGTNYPFYWTGTTHANWTTQSAGGSAVYVAFGEALGWMEQPPPGSGNYVLQDVHGAGAQRSDPKTGDPNDYPYGHGPQGDVIRIFNYVRAVRQASVPPTPTPTPTATPKNPDADTDGDTIANSIDPNDDNDGCTDDQENGLDETLGGRRDPHSPWDFYDVAGLGPSLPRDKNIDLPNDILPVILNYTGNPGYTPGDAAASGTPGIRDNYDRGRQPSLLAAG